MNIKISNYKTLTKIVALLIKEGCQVTFWNEKDYFWLRVEQEIELPETTTCINQVSHKTLVE